MSLADARFAWEAKAATLLDVRLRQRLASFAAAPSTWSDRLRVTVGHDSLDDLLNAQQLSRYPAVDVSPMPAEVIEHVAQDELRIQYEVIATVDASDIAESELGRWASWLAGAAVEVLTTYGADPSSEGPAWMVRADSTGDSPETFSDRQPYPIRVRGTITVALTALAVRTNTYMPSPAQPTTERGAVSPQAVTVAAQSAQTLRTTALAAASSPVVVDVGDVVASSVVVYSTAPGGNDTDTAAVVAGEASIDLAGVAGSVWTILLIDASTGAVVPLVVTWS